MTRTPKVQIAGRTSYRESIERYYAEHPEATQEQVRLATGATRAAVRRTFERLLAAGRVPSGRQRLKRPELDCNPE